MKKSLAVVAVTAAILGSAYILWPVTAAQVLPDPVPVVATTTPQFPLAQYLKSKKSPLVPDASFLQKQKHWKLIVAISAAESTFCKHQLDFNCWGIGGDSHYRHYKSFRAAIIDTNDLIEKWQLKGRWLTPEDMNCSYVVPCSPTWVRTVNRILKDIQ
jgi:hypothetical protein